MATTTVQIIGGKLDGAILDNAASEATLRDIVNAVNKMSGNKSSGGNGPIRTPPGVGSSSSVLGKAFGATAKGLGVAVGAVGAFTSMVASGNDKMSSYTKMLSDNVIKQIPILGGVLGGMADAVSSGIEVLEGWNTQLKSASQFGASFNNSILEIRRAAADSYNELDVFVGILKKHSQDLPLFGGTVTEGAKRLAAYNKQLYQGSNSAGEQLINMGMSTEGVTDALAVFMKHTIRGTKDQSLQGEEFTKSFLAYQKNIEVIKKLTGLNADAIEKKLAKEEENLGYQIYLNSLDTQSRARVQQTMAIFTSQYGEAGASLFRSALLGYGAMTPEAAMLAQTYPEIAKQAKAMSALAKDQNVGEQDFQRQFTQRQAEAISQALKTSKSYDANFAAMMLGVDGMQEFKGGTEELLKFLQRFVKNGDTSVEGIRRNLEEIKASNNQEDALTKILNNFGLGIKDLKSTFIDVFLEGLKDMGDIFEKENFNDFMKDMGKQLGEITVKYLPKVIDFFKYLGSDAGRQYLWKQFEYFFDYMGTALGFAIKELFGFGATQEEQDKAYEALRTKRDMGNTVPELGTRLPKDEDITPVAATEKSANAKAAIEKYLGREITDSEYSLLMRATHAEAGRDPKETALVLGSILNRARNLGGKNSIKEALYADNAFQAVTGTKANNHEPSVNFVRGPGAQRQQTIEGAAMDYLPKVNRQQTDFSAADPRAYGPGTSIEWKNNIMKRGGVQVGASVFNKGFDKEGEQPQQPPGQKFSTGTLGVYGKLFGEFGTGTNAVLHGNEFVGTPEQVANILKTGGDISLSELVNNLNANLATLAQLTRDKVDLHRNHLNILQSQTSNVL
jgi:hypothetical protein